MIGTKLANRYEIVAELGRGGMGVVYRAHDPMLNREVAIKLIPPQMLTADAEARFQHEAQVVAQMDHPAIVPVFDIGRHEEGLYFLMPLVRGTTLRTFIREHTLKLGEILDIGVQVAEALEYSHSRGIVHRDVKPENVMVERSEDGELRVRVMDFGLARGGTDNRLTKTGAIVGTLTYFSPEQLKSTPPDGRSDVYALGTVLYECLTGEPPFAGEMQSVIYRILYENPQPLRERGAEVTQEIEDAVMRSLEKESDARFQRAGEMAEALRRCRSRLEEGERERVMLAAGGPGFQAPRVPQGPLVGRTKEFGEMQRRLTAALGGECQLVLLGGEAGIGKGRLVEELEQLARAKRVRVLHGRFVEQDRAFSYQGFCELVQDFFRSEARVSSAEHPDFSDLAPDLVSLFPVLTEIAEVRGAASGDSKTAHTAEARRGEDRTYVFELLARTITRMAGGKPLLAVLKNLDAADISIEALQYIVRRLGPTPTLFVGTYRTGAVDKRHPLNALLEAFADDPRFAHIALAGLGPSEHRTLVESLMGTRHLSDELARRLYEATEANPFFTRELVRSLLDSGGIAADATGTYELSGEMGISSDALPATIQQAVEKRIERLSEELRDVLSIAAVLGRTFEFRDLEKLAEGKNDPEEAVEKLIREGFLEEERESRGDRLTFVSGIVRDVLYAEMSRRKRKSLHRRYAELLEKRQAGRLDRIYSLLLHHFSQGDVPEKSVEYGLKLARKSLETFSHDDVIRAARTVLEFLDDEEWEGERSLEGEARLLVAEGQRMAGHAEAALREAEAAARVFEQQGQTGRGIAAMTFAAETAWQARRIDVARRWLEQGIDEARTAADREHLLRLLSLGVTIANLRGEYARAKEYLEESERLGEAAGERGRELEVPRGGTLVVALSSPVRAREPAEVGADEEIEVLANVFETLVATDARGNLVPNLCESWSASADGRAVTVTLRPGIRFHDGSELTAAAVKASFERTIARATRRAAAFAAIEGLPPVREEGEAPAEPTDVSGLVARGVRELEIRLTEPVPIYPALLTAVETAILRAGEGTALPTGTGPFKIAAHAPERVLLARNEAYWRGTPPPLDAIEFRAALSASAIAEGLRSGALDVGRDLAPGDLEEMLRDPRFRGGLVETPRKITYFVLFNASGPMARNPEVRLALSRVVRTQDLVWRTLGRFAQPATGLIPPGVLGHDPGKRAHQLEREIALQMLGSTAFEFPVRLTAAIHPILRDRYGSLTAALLDAWKELGFEVENVTATMPEFLARNTDALEIDMKIGRYNADYDDPDSFTFGLFHSEIGVFRHYFSSVETDGMLEEARVEQRPAAREALYRKFENLLIDTGIVLPLFHEIDYRVASPRVRGLTLRNAPPYASYADIGKEKDALAPALAAAARPSGVLHVPIAGVVASLEPSITDTVEQSEVLPNVFETLFRGVEGARLVPWLASGYTVEEGGRLFRISLREDVRFHDGRRMTARDVRASYERLLLEKTSKSRWVLSPIRGAAKLMRGEANDLAGFHILSAHEIAIDLEEPLAFFPAMLSYPAAAIVPEGCGRMGASWRDGCVGTGPFRVVSFVPERRLELERNPHYWRAGLPKSEGLVFRFDMSSEEVMTEFSAGRLAIASDLFPADVEALRHDPELASGYREMPRLVTYFMVFNKHRGPFADRAVRRALVAAIDVPRLVRSTIGRLAIPARGLIPPGLLGHEAEPGGGTEVRSGTHRGTKVEVELTTAVHPVFFGAYSAIAAELSEAVFDAGMRLRVVTKTMPEYLQAHIDAPTDAIIGRWLSDYPDADSFVRGVLHTREGILGRYCGTPEIDKLGDRGRAEIDPRVRHTIYRQVEEILASEALILPLFHEQVYRFTRPEVEGLSINFSQPEVSYEHLRLKRHGG